eukprot:5239835-Amphidinium_carterae.1
MPALKTAKTCTMLAEGTEELAGMAELLEQHELLGQDDVKSMRVNRKGKGVEKAASYDLLRAWDHQLRMFGRGLAFFAPMAEKSQPLQENEVRYEVSVPSWATYEVPANTPWRRVCIKNVVSGAKRYEIPLHYGDAGPRVLIVNADECGSNLAPLQFACHKLQMRVLWIRDAAHRSWRDFRLAVGDSDMWAMVYDVMHVLGLQQGPWHSSQWYNALLEACASHFEHESSSNPLFQALLPELLVEMRAEGCLSSEPNSGEEEAEAWQVQQRCDLLRKRSSRVTLTRWFEVVERWSQFDRNYWRHFYCYLVLLWKTGIFKSVAEMPIWGVRTFEHNVKVTKAKQAGKRVTMQEASAEETLADERQKTQNAVHLGANILGMPGLQRRSRVFLCVGQVLYSAFSKEQKGTFSEDENFEYQLSYAVFAYSWVFIRLFRLLSSVVSLQRLGFVWTGSSASMQMYEEQMPKTTSTSSHAGSSGDVLEDRVLHMKVQSAPGDEEEFEVADLLFNLICNSIKHRGMSMMQYRWSLPGLFVLLCHNTHRAGALSTLKNWWSALKWLEVRRLKSPEVRMVYDSVGWLQNGVVREVLVSLAQHDFMCIPPELHKIFEGLFRGYANTILVEKCFQKLRDEQRESNNKEMQRSRRWLVPVDRQLLKEVGRKEVQPCAQLPESVKECRYPKSVFSALGLPPSWDDGELRQIQDGTAKYLSTSAQGLQLQPAAWCLLLAGAEAADMRVIEEGWHAVIFQEKCVIKHKSRDESWLVLKSCPYALLVWPVSVCKLGDAILWVPTLERNTSVKWLATPDISVWSCVEVQAIPPNVMRAWARSQQKELGVQIGLLQVSTDTPPLKMAAKSAFKSCTGTYIDKILKEYTNFKHVEKSERPKGVLAKLEFLVKHLSPELTESELQSIFLLRAGLSGQRSTSLLMTSSNIETAVGCMDAEDLKDASAFKQNCHLTGVAVKKHALAFLRDRHCLADVVVMRTLDKLEPKVRKSSEQQQQQPESEKVRKKEMKTWTEVHLKQHIPKVTGAYIQEVVPKNTWTAKYPTAEPKTRSRTWGGTKKMSREECARHCFTWLWKQHESATGEGCPFSLDFDALE